MWLFVYKLTPNLDFAINLCKLDSVALNIQEYLLKSIFICAYNGILLETYEGRSDINTFVADRVLLQLHDLIDGLFNIEITYLLSKFVCIKLRK